jgi:hypothetical protein
MIYFYSLPSVVKVFRSNGEDGKGCSMHLRNAKCIQNLNQQSPFGREEDFKYLGTTLTNQSSIQKEIKSRLKPGNAYYYSVQNLLSFVFYPKI